MNNITYNPIANQSYSLPVANQIYPLPSNGSLQSVIDALTNLSRDMVKRFDDFDRRVEVIAAELHALEHGDIDENKSVSSSSIHSSNSSGPILVTPLQSKMSSSSLPSHKRLHGDITSNEDDNNLIPPVKKTSKLALEPSPTYSATILTRTEYANSISSLKEAMEIFKKALNDHIEIIKTPNGFLTTEFLKKKYNEECARLSQLDHATRIFRLLSVPIFYDIVSIRPRHFRRMANVHITAYRIIDVKANTAVADPLLTEFVRDSISGGIFGNLEELNLIRDIYKNTPISLAIQRDQLKDEYHGLNINNLDCLIISLMYSDHFTTHKVFNNYTIEDFERAMKPVLRILNGAKSNVLPLKDVIFSISITSIETSILSKISSFYVPALTMRLIESFKEPRKIPSEIYVRKLKELPLNISVDCPEFREHYLQISKTCKAKFNSGAILRSFMNPNYPIPPIDSNKFYIEVQKIPIPTETPIIIGQLTIMRVGS